MDQSSSANPQSPLHTKPLQSRIWTQQESTEPLSALDRSFRTGVGLGGGKQNHIALTLMRAFFVIMREVLAQDMVQRLLAE